MLPKIFLGPVIIRTFWLMAVLGVICAVAINNFLREKIPSLKTLENVPAPRQFAILAGMLFFFGIIGAKTADIIWRFPKYAANPWEIFGPKFISFGFLFSTIIITEVYCRIRKFDTLKTLDLIFFTFPVFQFF